MYWLDDNGGRRVPESWRVLYRRVGEWEPVEIQVVPPKGEAAKAAPPCGRAAWGEAVNGLQAGLATAFDRARPCQIGQNVPLILQDNHYHMAATTSARAGPATFSQLLGPGRHTIRVDIDGVVSNPVTIDIVAEEPGGAAFGPVIERAVTEQPSKATTYLDLDTGKYAPPSNLRGARSTRLFGPAEE